MRFLIRRIAFYVVTAWAAITMNFLIPRLMPGSPENTMLSRFQGQISKEQIAAIKARIGVGNASLLSQYGTYWKDLLHGDLGTSVAYFPGRVSEVIGQGLWWTVVLVGVATAIGFVLGTLLGVAAAWKRGSFLDHLLPVTTFFAAVPYFWIALVALSVFGAELGWFPLSGGYRPELEVGWSGEFIASAFSHSVLPAATIVVGSIAGWLLGMRNMMLTTLSEDYVLVAEAKGLRTRRVMLGYAARNALLPNISGFAMSLGFIVSGSIVTETVFSYPGIGFMLYNAVLNNDYPLMQGLFLIITLMVLLANFVVDLCYVLLDPRIRQEAR
ncbi:MAG: ABC transporter permease [Streptomycetaceae bacterium]|nr:ABC transporter permease [Streptomycetaceae bacterium]